MDQEKRERRILKRELKRAGHKHDRQRARRDLDEAPEEAHLRDEPDFGRYTTRDLNGLDRDATRRRGDSG